MTAREVFQRRVTGSEGNTYWTNSALVQAMLHGSLCILDGLHRLPITSLSALQVIATRTDSIARFNSNICSLSARFKSESALCLTDPKSFGGIDTIEWRRGWVRKHCLSKLASVKHGCFYFCHSNNRSIQTWHSTVSSFFQSHRNSCSTNDSKQGNHYAC